MSLTDTHWLLRFEDWGVRPPFRRSASITATILCTHSFWGSSNSCCRCGDIGYHLFVVAWGSSSSCSIPRPWPPFGFDAGVVMTWSSSSSKWCEYDLSGLMILMLLLVLERQSSRVGKIIAGRIIGSGVVGRWLVVEVLVVAGYNGDDPNNDEDELSSSLSSWWWLIKWSSVGIQWKRRPLILMLGASEFVHRLQLYTALLCQHGRTDFVDFVATPSTARSRYCTIFCLALRVHVYNSWHSQCEGHLLAYHCIAIRP